MEPVSRRLLLTSTLMALAGWATGARAQSGYEAPPVLRARDLAPADLLQGPHHQVEDRVPTDGLLATFTIVSDFGRFAARGPGMLHTRVAEVRALAALAEMKKSDVFANALKESAQRTARSVGAAVVHPVETVKSLPEGIGRFFSGVTREVKTGSQKLGDVADQAKQKPAAGEGGPAAADVAAAAGHGAASAGEGLIGYADARRRLARSLAVDPYTTNPILAAQLDQTAWAAWAGSFGLDQMLGLVPGGVVITWTTWTSDQVWEQGPSDLRVTIDQKLKTRGVSQDAVDRFLRHPVWTLTLQATLVQGLDALGDVPGAAPVIALALTAASEDQARFLAGAATLLARSHRTVPLAELRVAGTVAGRTAGGALVVPGPVDHVAWTERLARFAERTDLQTPQRLLYLTGRATPRARRELTARGWRLEEGVPLAQTVVQVDQRKAPVP